MICIKASGAALMVCTLLSSTAHAADAPATPVVSGPVASAAPSNIDAFGPRYASLVEQSDALLTQTPSPRDAIPVGPAAGERDGYDFRKFTKQAASIPWEAGGVAAGITVLGFTNWKWGNTGFHFQSEGWFDKDSSSYGMDKLGHAYSTYLITELLTDGIRRNAANPAGGEITAGLLAMGLMTYVEIFDGFSTDHGFSYEDMIADAAGAAFSMIRSSVPGLKEKLDFRLQYLPSNNVSGFHPITDYSGQKYVFALKLAGFEGLERSPLRFVELHGGYFARGFTEEEKLRGVRQRRVPFVGIGLNLQQLLFGRPAASDTRLERWGRKALEYVQVPYTAVHSD